MDHSGPRESRSEPEAEDETLEEDKVTLAIWKDPYLQPMQLVQAEDERKRTYAAVVHVDSGVDVQLSTTDVPTVRFAAEADAAQATPLRGRPAGRRTTARSGWRRECRRSTRENPGGGAAEAGFTLGS